MERCLEVVAWELSAHRDAKRWTRVIVQFKLSYV